MEQDQLRMKALELALSSLTSVPQRSQVPEAKAVVDCAEIYYAFLAKRAADVDV
jgi:hypothetical protein